MEPKNTESKIGAPEPRANHTANYFKEKVYIFGGHGGVGYQRTSYNDVHFFDCETSEWTKVEIQGGVAPEARGGHSSMVLAEKEMLIIYGGWSSTNQFSDIHAFNLVTHTWTNPDLNHDIPRWYHSCICVPAIPSWKFFVFGGSTGQFAEGENRTLSRFSDDIFYLDVPDIKDMKWNTIPIKGNIPKGRENGAIFWDANDSKLILFGGWANTWL
jgi:dynein heavy chain